VSRQIISAILLPERVFDVRKINRHFHK